MPDPYLVDCETSEGHDSALLGLDATVEFPPHRHHALMLNGQIAGLDPEFGGLVTSYHSQVAESFLRRPDGYKRLRCVFPTWDNAARLGPGSTLFVESNPELFGYWIETMAQETWRRLCGEDRLLFVNAWSELAEGCCLAPDGRYGTQYLEAPQQALVRGARLPAAPLERPRFADVVQDTRAAVDAGELAVVRHGDARRAGATVVSVVMPIYNHERYLGRTLASLAAQMRLPDELVAVDDGSTDGSVAVVKRFARTARFPVALAHPANRGAHVALDRGLALARGSVVALLNSDDAFHPRRLERLVAALDDRCELVFSGVEFVDDDDRPASGSHVDNLRVAFSRIDREESLFEAKIRHNVAVSTGNFLFRRSLALRVGGFAGMEVCHDWDWLLAATWHTRVARVNQPLYRYRTHGANTYAARVLAGTSETETLLGRFLARIGTHPQMDDSGRERLRQQLVARGQEHLWPAGGRSK